MLQLLSDKDGKELLVAVSFGLAASEAVADRRTSFQIRRWEAYARLYKKVSEKGWFKPGHGDWCTCLEKYTLCRDGIYHKSWKNLNIGLSCVLFLMENMLIQLHHV